MNREEFECCGRGATGPPQEGTKGLTYKLPQIETFRIHEEYDNVMTTPPYVNMLW